jgi:A/G-specific adenine glycosylase
MVWSHLIIKWYEENKRDLPWRHTQDPYRIWISEVILQQTRVEQGMAYYGRFIERFPDVGSLANASGDEVMKVWQGLGYYSRARNLHSAAKSIVEGRDSDFPASYDELKRLKGIGDYSASAIASIAYGEPCPVVDGNVIRVMTRLAGIYEPAGSSVARTRIKTILREQIDHEKPGVFNQALMELGALVCKPRQPLCGKCPLKVHCHAFKHEHTDLLPNIIKSKPLKVRYLNYLVILCNENERIQVWLKKRTGKDIWKNLYDFPLIETTEDIPVEDLKKTGEWKNIAGYYSLDEIRGVETVRHLLSHRELRVRFLFIFTGDYSHQEYKKVSLEDIHNYPVPRIIEEILKKIST